MDSSNLTISVSITPEMIARIKKKLIATAINELMPIVAEATDPRQQPPARQEQKPL